MIRPAFHDYLIETQDKKNPLRSEERRVGKEC